MKLIKVIKVKLKSFLFPPTICYEYKIPIDGAKAALNQILNKESAWYDAHNYTGNFISNDTFTMMLKTPYYIGGKDITPILTGKLSENGNTTLIKITVKHRLVVYFTFFITTTSGIVFLLLALINKNPPLWEALFILIIPAVIIAISDLFEFAIREKYMDYIHKPLIK